MRTKIKRMIRFGRGWTVYLDCGHTYQTSTADILSRQLFINKPVTCQESHL